MEAFYGDKGRDLTFMIGPHTSVGFLKEKLARNSRTIADKLTLYSAKVEMIDDFKAIVYCKPLPERSIVRLNARAGGDCYNGSRRVE